MVDSSCHCGGHAVVNGLIVVRAANGPTDRIAVCGADHLGNAAGIVPQETVGNVDHPTRAAVVDLQRVIAGTREQSAEVDQPRGISAVVAVDGLIVVADTEYCCVGACEQADQQQVGGGEVLELVDQHDAARPLGNCPCGMIVDECLECQVDLFVEVDRAGGGELAAELGEDVGEPVDLAVVQRLDLGRCTQPEPSQ